jgi:hypothetical protein
MLDINFELRIRMLTGIFKEIMGHLHDTTGMLDDRDVGTLKHFQRTILKTVHWLKHS